MAAEHLLAAQANLTDEVIEIGFLGQDPTLLILGPEEARKLAIVQIPAALAELEKHRNAR